jgi:phage-related baseplate assembly protein
MPTARIEAIVNVLVRHPGGLAGKELLNAVCPPVSAQSERNRTTRVLMGLARRGRVRLTGKQHRNTPIGSVLFQLAE